MCFDMTHKRPKIALRDIVCYKVSASHHRAIKTFRPVYMDGFEYKINIPAPKEKLSPNPLGEIHIGYHSYKDKKTMSTEWGFFDCKKAGKFVIPKGSRYYENDIEYVSETLIFKGIIK